MKAQFETIGGYPTIFVSNEDKAKNFSNCCEEGAKEFRLEEASVEDWEDCPF